MRKLSTRKLASELANMARQISALHGDVTAQIIAYSLFLHRLNPRFDIQDVLVNHPCPNEVSEIKKILHSTDFDAIFTAYQAEDKDPSIYFFEEFLQAYDSAGARSRGVHYSPPAVVSYMVRSVESVLRSQFNSSLEDAVILDPCCGIGTFLHFIEQHYNNCKELIGIELMNAPCELASRLLQRAKVIQANSLDDITIDTGGKPLIIIGNPPYSGHSANPGGISEMMADYRANLIERNPKWLQDDYVKFLRMAQARIENEGRGIIAFITNHSYIFNPTFRAMRSCLMKAFDEIYVLDLHGNAKKAESGQDENIFPIQMGVAISILVKTSERHECRVRHAHLRGSKLSKFDALSNTNIYNTRWEEVPQIEPFYLFIPNEATLQEEYQEFTSLFDIFEKSSVGFVTSRDTFAVDCSREALLERITTLRDSNISPDEIRAHYRIGDLDIKKTRYILQNDPEWQSKAVEVLYRPYDHRWAYLSSAVMERPRLPFMTNLLRDNIALAVGRAGQVTGSGEWDVIFCTDRPTDLNLFRRGGAMLFPLYIYEQGERCYNIKSDIQNPEELFFYIYAILHSSQYRAKYAEMLAIDYPRVPMPIDHHLAHELADMGKALVSTHLMQITSQQSTADTSTRIGGYFVPKKLLEMRPDINIEFLNRVRGAIVETAAIREEIDSIIRRGNLI